MKNDLIEEIYRTKLVFDAKGNSRSPFPEGIKYEQGMGMYEAVRRTGARQTVEVGMACGLSTLFLCQGIVDNAGGAEGGLAGVGHVAIDPFQVSGFGSIGVLNAQRSGFGEIVRFLALPSHLGLARLQEEGKSFDLVFIDGSHLFDYAFVDFFLCDKLIRPGGVVLVDDLWMPSVRKVLMFVLKNLRYEVAEDLYGPRPGVGEGWGKRARYQWRRFWRGGSGRGVWGERRFHLGRNQNWCALRKVKEDDRDWRHFVGF